MITVDGRPVAQLGPIEPGRPAPSPSTTWPPGAWSRCPAGPTATAPEVAVPVWAGFRLDRLLRDVRGR